MCYMVFSIIIHFKTTIKIVWKNTFLPKGKFHIFVPYFIFLEKPKFKSWVKAGLLTCKQNQATPAAKEFLLQDLLLTKKKKKEAGENGLLS